jgi:2-aminoadipate transaminase
MTTTADTATWEPAFAARVSAADDGGAIAAILSQVGAPAGLITLSGGFPAPETFPTTILSDLTTALLERDAGVALQYAPTQGLASVREAIADRLGTRDGHRPADAELMITSGGIDALGLLARSLIDPGDVVLVEAPTYLGGILTFAGFQADVVGVPMDQDGLDVDALSALLAGGLRPKLLYSIPDHQNPTGLTLAADRRAALVEVCRRHGVLIVEDVAYRELGFDDQPLPSLLSLGPDVVVQIGTFSKTFFPGVRLGWAAGPAALISQLVNAKQFGDQCAGALGQRLVEEYMRGGHLDRQLIASRAIYAERAAATMAALEAHMPPGVTWTTPRGGFFSWVTLPEGGDAVALASKALAAGVAIVPGGPFHPGTAPDRGRRDLRLSFSRVDPTDITTGITRLASAIAQ